MTCSTSWTTGTTIYISIKCINLYHGYNCIHIAQHINHMLNQAATVPLSLRPLPSLNWTYFPSLSTSSSPLLFTYLLSFFLFLTYNLPVAAQAHHSPVPFPTSISLFLFHFYCFKLTSADWPATPITCYTQQEALTHRDNQCVRMHNNISFIFGVLWKLFMKTLNVASMCWYKLAYEQRIPLGCSVWSRAASRIFTQWWVSK